MSPGAPGDGCNKDRTELTVATLNRSFCNVSQVRQILKAEKDGGLGRFNPREIMDIENPQARAVWETRDHIWEGNVMDQVHSVEELLQRAAKRHIPLEKMRCFVNKDSQEPHCFGIYQDEYTGNWIVYRNRMDGSRSIRYSGPNEARAAYELWIRIKAEIGPRRGGSHRWRTKMKKAKKIIKAVLIALIVAGIGVYAYIEYKKPRRGYYVYDDSLFYYQNSAWYYFDDYNDEWKLCDAPADRDRQKGVWYGDRYPFGKQGSDFIYSIYYEPPGPDDFDPNVNGNGDG